MVATNIKKIASVALILILMVSALSFVILTAFPAKPANAVLPTVKLGVLPNCPSGSFVSGAYYESSSAMLWQSCYDSGFLYKVNFATTPATVTSYDVSATVGSFNVFSVWGDANNIYLAGRNGQVFKFVKATSTISTLATGLAPDVTFITTIQGFLMVSTGNGVAKIDVSTGAVTLIQTSVQMLGIVSDGSVIYATAPNAGRIYEINPVANSATLVVSGLANPYGISLSATSLYVALFNVGGQTVQISRSTWAVVNAATASGTCRPYGVIKISSYVLFSCVGSGGSDNDVYVRNAADMSTVGKVSCPVNESGSCRPLFMMQTDGINVFVSFMGSVGTAMVGNWLDAAGGSTTTTTTTTAVTSTAWVTSTSWVTSTRWVTSTSSSSSTSTTTSTTTTSSSCASTYCVGQRVRTTDNTIHLILNVNWFGGSVGYLYYLDAGVSVSNADILGLA